MSRLPRLILSRLLPAFVLLVLLVLTFVWHWNDRALLWWQEYRTPPEVRAQAVWLPDYQAVIQGKQLPGLAEAETSDLTYDPRTRTLFAVTGSTPYLVQLSLTGDILRRIPIRNVSNLEGVTALLAMLASCAAGLTVVGIDNGFGAACAVARLLR